MAEPSDAERAEGVLERARLRRVSLIVVGVVAIAALAFTVRVVPDVSGLSQGAATGRIRGFGLDPEVEVVYRGDPGQVKVGTLLGQRPQAWTPTLRHRTVTVYVVAGPERVRVPDLRGMSIIAASAALAGTQLDLDAGTLEQAKNPHDRLITSTDPAAPALVPHDASVRLTLASASTQDWIRRHAKEVKAAGTVPCLARCHSERYCGGCHVKTSGASDTPK